MFVEELTFKVSGKIMQCFNYSFAGFFFRFFAFTDSVDYIYSASSSRGKVQETRIEKHMYFCY